MGPNAAFCLSIFGMLGVYCELIWPGRVWQGVLGAAGAVMGGYSLWQAGPSAFGLMMLGIASSLYFVDALAETLSTAGITATGALVSGFGELLPGTQRINPVLNVLLCVVFGVVTIALNRVARRARKNKRAH